MTDLNSIFQLINPDNTIMANRTLAHAIGMTETIVYSALISKYTYYESRDMLFDEKWFYCTTLDLQESTTFSWKIQKKAIDNLVRNGLIEIKLAGVPAKRYFAISDDIDLLREILNKGIKNAEEISRLDSERTKEKGKLQDAEKTIPESDRVDKAIEINSFAQKEKLESPKGRNKDFPKGETRIAQKEKLDSPEGRNKFQQKGETSFDDWENKSKDNKTIAEESKDNQSIYLEKENVYFSPKYIERLVGCIAGGGTSQEATELVIHYGYEALSDSSEIVKLRRRIAENIDLKRIISEQFAGKTIDMSKIEMVWEIYDLICDMVCNNQEGIKINRTVHDWEEVRGQFLKLGYIHVMNVTDRVLAEDSPKKNMRAYLISSLYNASMTELILTESKNRNRHRCISGDDIIAK